MKKYLKEIEISGLILTAIGVGLSYIKGIQYGVWPCGIGLFLLLLIFLYKAFNWKVYAKDNSRNIIWMLVTIVMLFLIMLMKR